MNKLFFRRNALYYSSTILLLILLFSAYPSALSAQADPHFILDHLDLIINVNNIATRGEISLRGLTANFPYPIMATISVVDSDGVIVSELADPLRWLKPNDIAENGVPINQIWQPVLEYHEENHAIPPDPNLYNQLPETQFTEVRWTDPIPTSTMLVMDVSSSMTNEIDDAKAGACLYVDLMRPVDRGGVVQFSGTVDVFQAMTNNTSLLKDIINNATVNNGTAVYDGIMAAIGGIKKEAGRRAVIVYTDGQNNVDGARPEAVIDSAQAYNLPIYTIALGPTTAEDTLKMIADSTGGLFFKAATAEEMKIIYGKLSVLMQNYYVMAYASPDPFFNKTWRLVDVTVKLPDKEGTGVGRYFIGGPPANMNTDVSAWMASTTDTSVDIAGDSINAVKPGEPFEYTLKARNLGLRLADTVKIIHFLPDSVDFLSASVTPKLVSDDSLEWEFTDIVPQRELTIAVAVQLRNNIPRQLTDLISEVKVSAVNDTNTVNNFDSDSIKVLFPELPQNYDLSLIQHVFADTTINLAGNEVPAVVAGDSYRCLLTITNSGPGTAYDFSVLDVLPDWVTPIHFTFPATGGSLDSLFWQFDSLTVGDSIQIAFDLIVADSLPSYPFPLINVSELVASNDTTPDNNFTSTTVYAIKKSELILHSTDLAITLNSITDTTIVVDQHSVNAVFPGDTFRYWIKVTNWGANSADTVQVVQQLPDSVFLVSADLPPKFSTPGSLTWEFFAFQPGNQESIRVDVRIAESVSEQLTELISRAFLTAANDSTPTNNFAADTVKVLFQELPINVNYNLAVGQEVSYDTSITVGGETVPAVWRGNSYHYFLKVQNFGPATARDITLWNALPDSISILNISPAPMIQTPDSLFWQFDSLAKGDSVIIALDVFVAEVLPFTPFPLFNETGLIAERDTSATDNISSSLIYAIARPDDPQNFQSDIAVGQAVATDSLAVAGNDTVRFARANETYSYTITVANINAVAAQEVKVIDILPDSITASNYQPLPELITDDSLVWSLGVLLPQTKVVLHFNATVSPKMPIGKNFLINEVKVTASNEDPTRLANNHSTTTVINLVRPPSDWQPDIEALPRIIKVGNPISVRVKVTAPIESWDMWVYLANGQIDSSYADNFIASNSLVPEEWKTIDPAYSETRLYTEAKQEELIFELRVRDVWGELKTAKATVTIESDDDLVVDKDVFIPDRDNELPIRFKLSSDRQVRLEIFDITGTKITNVAEGQFQAGWNTYAWNGLTDNGQKIGSGFYILTIRSGEYQAWKKLMIIR